MTYEEAMKIKGRLLTDEEAANVMKPLVEKYGRTQVVRRSQPRKKMPEGLPPRVPDYTGHYPVYRGEIES